MKSGTFSMLPMSVSIRMTASLAPAVPWSVQGGGRGGRGRVGIGMRRTDDAHGRGRAVLLVVGVQDEQDVQGAGQDRVGLEARLGDLPEHGEEVRNEIERVVGVDEGHAHAESVRRRGQGRHLGDEADDLLVAGLGIEDVLGVEIEGRQGGDGRDQHPHRVGVVVEALEEPLADVLVDERVVRDIVAPVGELLLVGQLALQAGDRPPPGRSSSRPAAQWGSPGSAGCRHPRRDR